VIEGPPFGARVLMRGPVPTTGNAPGPGPVSRRGSGTSVRWPRAVVEFDKRRASLLSTVTGEQSHEVEAYANALDIRLTTLGRR
jgi:hypothetical protein